MGIEDKVAEVDKVIRDKQSELLEAGNDQRLIEKIGDAIIDLREERQAILIEAALKHDLQERMEDLISFLDEQTEAVEEYSEALARRLIEKITVYDEELVDIMQWYEEVLDRIDDKKTYCHKELMDELRKLKTDLSDSTYHWAINGLVRNGALTRQGYV